MAAGPVWTQVTNKPYVIISPFETDTVHVSNTNGSINLKLGVGYHFCPEPLIQNFPDDLLTELNVYYSSQAADGYVLQYELPQFNNYSFHAPLHSTRLMLDFKPRFCVFRSLYIYPIAGFGIAFNDIAYRETVTNIEVGASSYESLDYHMNIDLAYNLGAGFSTPITHGLMASLEFLYTNFSHIKHPFNI